MTAQRALNCIPDVGDGTLRATQPAALNDPFECAVATLYVFRGEAEENRELAKVLTEINENKPISAKEVRTARIEHGSLFTRQLLADQISTRFGIVSFSTNPRHPLMWSLYTTDGSGFVIGYDTSELKELGGPEGDLRAVQYGSPATSDQRARCLFSTQIQHTGLFVGEEQSLVPRGRMAPDCGIEQDGRDRTNRPTRSTHKSRPNTERGGSGGLLHRKNST